MSQSHNPANESNYSPLSPRRGGQGGERLLLLSDRVSRASALFTQGYNCAQSVVAAYADLFGLDESTALRMSASFGGGIGRMRQTCGAACGMFLLAGLHCGTDDPNDREAKSHNYAVVQQLARAFEEENGSLICAQLLGLEPRKRQFDPEAEPRTEEYYKKRPCRLMVETAARLFGVYLLEHPSDLTPNSLTPQPPLPEERGSTPETR